MKKLALYFVSFCSLFFFVGCSSNSVTPTQLTVMFNTDGGSAVAQETVEENKKATKPADPTKDLYTFVGWYSDEALTTSFDFETPITANTTLYAKWAEKTFTVTYKSDANTEVGTEKVSQVTPTLTKNTSLVEGKYIVGFFTDEAQAIAFDFSKNLTADVTIYVTLKDIVTPADRAALETEIDNAIAEQGNSPDLNYINTEKIKDMSLLFNGIVGENNIIGRGRAFNGDISEWNVSGVTDMIEMFREASVFNGDISKWDVSAVRDMEKMFTEANEFNSDISEWKVSAVKTMFDMFRAAHKFNSDISKWDVSAVENMDSMFDNATIFNQDISGWNVSNVNSMNKMFSSAWAFNADISGWDVGRVGNISQMFANTRAFNQDLEEWKDHLTLVDGKYTGAKSNAFIGARVLQKIPTWF